MAKHPSPRKEKPSRHTCPHCGAEVSDPARGCRALYSEVSFRELGDKARYPVHRLTVSAYALQHPDEYCRSEKALATHLTAFCVAFEYDGDSDVGRALKRWLDGRPAVERLSPRNSGER
jgi:hypothetical protein